MWMWGGLQWYGVQTEFQESESFRSENVDEWNTYIYEYLKEFFQNCDKIPSYWARKPKGDSK
jgi:hypothetical protein